MCVNTIVVDINLHGIIIKLYFTNIMSFTNKRKLQKTIESGTSSVGRRKQLLFQAISKKCRYHQLNLIYETYGEICLNMYVRVRVCTLCFVV